MILKSLQTHGAHLEEETTNKKKTEILTTNTTSCFVYTTSRNVNSTFYHMIVKITRIRMFGGVVLN